MGGCKEKKRLTALQVSTVKKSAASEHGDRQRSSGPRLRSNEQPQLNGRSGRADPVDTADMLDQFRDSVQCSWHGEEWQ